DAALLCRLDDVAPHPPEVDALGHGMTCEDRLQHGNAELRRLLDHVIEPGPLQRCEEIKNIGTSLLRPDLLQGLQHAVALALERQTRSPLAIPAVENENFCARTQTQNVSQIVRLLGRAANRLGGAESRLD